MEPLILRFAGSETILKLVYKNLPVRSWNGVELNNSDCVLDRIDIEAGNGERETMVTYRYQGLPRAGTLFASALLSHVGFAPGAGTNEWAKFHTVASGEYSTGRMVVVPYPYEQGPVGASELTQSHAWSKDGLAWGTFSSWDAVGAATDLLEVVAGTGCSNCCNADTFVRLAKSAPFAPNDYGKSILRSFYWAADGGLGWGLNGPLPESASESCRDGTNQPPNFICASGTTSFIYGQASTETDPAEVNQCGQLDQPVVLLAEKDKNEAFSQFSTRFLASVAGGSFEQQRVVSGASGFASSDGLEEASMSYEYTDRDQQVVSRVDHPSVVSPGLLASTRTIRGPRGVEKAVIRSGVTMVAGQTEQREQGTFMLRKDDGRRPCSQLEEPSDSVHSVLGPCSVQGDACQPFAGQVSGVAVNQEIPITEFYYYGAGEVPLELKPRLGSTTNFNSGRLFAIRQFPNGCNSAPLDTVFADYSATGEPRIVQSSDGRTVESEFRGGLLVAMRLNSGARFEFEWDRGRLTRTLRPEGDSTVICTEPRGVSEFNSQCHRDGLPGGWTVVGAAGSGKVQGSLHDKTSWIADVARPPILRTVRTQAFEYVGGSVSAQALLGRLSQTLHGDATCASEPCFKRTDVLLDADLRSAGMRVGTKGVESDWASTLRRDSMSNVVAAAAGVNLQSTVLGDGKPMPFCLGNESNCAWFAHDRLGRLASAYWPRDGVSSCIAYDRQGNVSVVAQGCLGDPRVACASGFDWTLVDGESVVGGPTCGHRQEYLWDDFGKVVAVRDGETGAVTRYSYYPNGDLLSEESQEQRSHGESTVFRRDSMGRATGVSLARSGSQTQMLERTWDSAPAFPQGCEPSFPSPVLASLKGHVAYTEDPVWNTWFAYDHDGRLRGEHRIAAGQASQCSLKPESVSNTTSYQYTPNGNIESIRHPFGRQVRYHYPVTGDDDNNLPERVSAELFAAGGVSVFVTVADSIKWTPDKRLASFVSVNYAGFGVGEGATTPIETYRTLTTLDYGIESTVRPNSCGLDLSFASRDFTGRLRRIRVEELKPSGLTAAVLYERYYTWAADQIVAIDLCYEDQRQPIPEFTAPLDQSAWPFDQQNRLLVNQVQDFGSLQNSRSRSYSYDSLGNRWTELLDSANGVGWNYAYGVSSTLTSVWPTGVNEPSGGFRGYREFEFDEDGRQVKSLGAWTTTGQRNSSMSFAFPSSAMISGGQRSVVRGVEVQGGNSSPIHLPLAYNYYYDGDNKRTRKEYPNTATEDYFYDQSKRLIVERSFSGLHEDNGVVLDEYVYLGGVPIFVVRAAMDHGNRKADFTGWCARRNEPGYCGLTQVVSDEMGRPLMALDQGMRVIGVGEYDAFGYRNRVRVPGQETNHPADQIEVELATKLGRAQAGVLESAVRARVSFFDATVKLGQVPRVELRESGSNVALSSASGPLPMMVTPFHRGSSFSVVYVPDGSGGDGAVLDGFEYDRLSSSAAVQYFPPIRFPGQYYDEESDLHENWNRYFDPGTGRYLSPEPLLQSPAYVRRMAQTGMSVPTYAYAANNPLRYTDFTGREIEILPDRSVNGVPVVSAAAQIAGGWALGEMLSNPAVGNATARVMMDPINKIGIGITDGLGLVEYGGGRTSPPSKRANGGLYCETRQSMDSHYAWAADPSKHGGLPLDPGLPLLDWTSMISHEFGHGVAYIYGLPNRPVALFFENAIRATHGSPPRASHEWPTAPFFGPAR